MTGWRLVGLFRRVFNASADELTRVEGVGNELAGRIQGAVNESITAYGIQTALTGDL